MLLYFLRLEILSKLTTRLGGLVFGESSSCCLFFWAVCLPWSASRTWTWLCHLGSTPMIPRALSLFWVVVWCCFFSFICFLVFFVYSMCTWCTFSCAFNLLIYLSIYIYIYAYLWQGADLPSTQVAYMDHPKFPTRPKKREKERTKTNIRPSEGT